MEVSAWFFFTWKYNCWSAFDLIFFSAAPSIGSIVCAPLEHQLLEPLHFVWAAVEVCFPSFRRFQLVRLLLSFNFLLFTIQAVCVLP